MTYKWEKVCLQKYGAEVTSHLIKQQQEYEGVKWDNDCKHCGKGNEGAIIESGEGKPFIMRYGLWTNKRCNYCGKYQQVNKRLIKTIDTKNH